ncbi:vicilin-like antimicrobial peptides 2-3 [Carica papaya]|uniref:vicilin-like antimicrobial peptides 2-3 n=1 Tax=Carica papaya TaxID=3649 RepID=UPI000B8C8EB8|nr:vicilin-like antimicrobial peptides 2-3 [Carica papaya]
MAIKTRSPLLLLFFLLFFLLSAVFLHSSASDQSEDLDELELNGELDESEEEYLWNQQDPARREYQQCQQRCQRQQGQSQQQCRRSCDQQLQRRRQRFRQCQQQCQRRLPQERQECQRMCQQQSRQGTEVNQDRSNPYYFDYQSFRNKYQSPSGHFKVLHMLTDKNPQLFEGFRNYRFAFLVANPNTFIQPHYVDAVSILVVVQGRGTVSLVCQEGRESLQVERGHVIRVPAGVLVYLSNPDNNQVLQIARLIEPVLIPGLFKEYFITEIGNKGGSVLSQFSQEVLESSLNTPRQEIERVLQSQRRPAIEKASPELLRKLSQQATSSPRQIKEILRPFNLLRQKPAYSNNWGQFFEAHPRQHRLLEDLDVSVNIAQMKQGSIFVPHYNSKATTVVLVTKGRVRFEMGCPHVSSMQRQGGAEQGQMQRIVAQASAGEAFLIPANHPVASTAVEDAETVGFGIRTHNNERNFLAGQNNIINNMEDAAKALTFGPQQIEQVKRVFRSNPNESYFVGSKRREGGHHGVSWILELEGLAG